MSDIKLGQLINGPAQRDAIHVAVVAVTSDEELKPGTRVGLVEGSTDKVQYLAALTGAEIGIVDPFLRATVKPGERFWLVLFPQTITSLRHVWEHPSFAVAESSPSKPVPDTEKFASETWLKEYVRVHCPYWSEAPGCGYGEFLRYVNEERWIYYYGSDCHHLDDVQDADELFRHLSVILDKRIDATYFEAFHCSC